MLPQLLLPLLAVLGHVAGGASGPSLRIAPGPGCWDDPCTANSIKTEGIVIEESKAIVSALSSVMPRILTGTTARTIKENTPSLWPPWTESMHLQRSRISRLPRTGWLSISRTLTLHTEES